MTKKKNNIPPGDLANVEYPCISITPRSIVTQSGSTRLSPVQQSNNSLTI